MYLYLLTFIHLAFADFSFMSMGDWGGDDAPKYTKESQCAAAEGMEEVARKYNIDTVIAAGDNFYHYGVTESNVDKYMQRTFNDVYKGAKLEKARFYAIAGNHDHRGSVEAQIGYKSPTVTRWEFPDYWYSFTKDIGNNMYAEFLMIDTVLLVGESYHDIERNIFVAATGPKNLQRAQSQWSWIQNKLAASNADFLFVVGHYPVYSPCSHGSTADLVEYLEPLLRKYHVTAYISGHDHCASYVDKNDGPVYPMNGMGDTCCYKAKKKKKLYGLLDSPQHLKWYVASDNKRDFNYPSAGFSSYTLQHDGTMIVRFHDEDGYVIFDDKTQSERVRLRMAREAEENANATKSFLQDDHFKILLLGLGSCMLSFIATMAWRQCRKSNSELQEDLMMDVPKATM